MEFHSFKQLGESMIRREVDTTPEIIAEARRLHQVGDRDGAKRKLKELRDIVAKLLEWDKRRDADEITDSITDLLADLDERGFIYLMKDVVSEGRFFTFIDAPQGLEPHVTRTTASGAVEKLPPSCRMILPHVQRTTLSIDDIIVEHGEAPGEDVPQLAAIWPVVAHFLPEENVTLEVYDPTGLGGSGGLRVESVGEGGESTRDVEVTLDSFGRGRHTFARLESGEYRATYQPEVGSRQSAAFRVGEPRRSSVSMRVQRAFIRSDRVSVRLQVSVLGQPFRGRGVVKISDRSTGKPVATISGYVKKGALDIDFSVRNDLGPFDLRLEKGAEHATAVLPLVRRVSTTIAQPGGDLRLEGGGFQVNGEGGDWVPWMGMRLYLDGADKSGGSDRPGGGEKPKSSWIRIVRVEGDLVQLELAEAAGPVTVLCRPALGGEEVAHSFERVEAGGTISVPMPSAFATLKVGAFMGAATGEGGASSDGGSSREHVREAVLLAFRKVPNHATIDVPQKALPGEPVKIKVEHAQAAHSILVVTPDSREAVDPYYELRSRVVDDIMSREGNLGGVPTKPRVIRHGKVTSQSAGRSKETRPGTKKTAVAKRPANRNSARKAVVPPLPTTSFQGERPALAYSTTFVGQGEFSREVTLPPTEHRWRLTLFSVSADGFSVVDRFVNVRGRSDFSLDLPEYVGTGDRIDGSIHYRTTRESALHVVREGKRRSNIVKGSAREPVIVSRPTKIEVELYEVGVETPQIARVAEVKLLEHEVGRVVELRILSEGEEYERAGVQVVQSLGELITRVAGALDCVPFDHAEVLAARLGATELLRRLVASGAISGSVEALDSELRRRWKPLAACQADNGLFSPAPGRPGDAGITRQVLKCTIALRTLPGGAAELERLLPRAADSLSRAAEALADLGVQDARLAGHSARLDRDPEAFEEIGAWYFREEDPAKKAELARRIIDPVEGVEIPRWAATVSYGGDDEATADALKVCLTAGENSLFDRGFTAFAGHLVNYRLRSPSSTLSLLKLLALCHQHFGDGPAPGSYDQSGTPELPRIRATRGRVLVRIETEASIPRAHELEEGTAPQIELRCQATVERLRPGDLVTVSVQVNPPSPSGYELTVMLPGILAFREGHEQQIGRFLLTESRRDFQALAVRTGQGLLRATAESIADRRLGGIAPPQRLICELPPPPPGHRGGGSGGGGGGGGHRRNPRSESGGGNRNANAGGGAAPAAGAPAPEASADAAPGAE